MSNATTTAKIHIDAQADLRVAGLPTHERAVTSLERALRRGCATIADAAGYSIEYVDLPEETDEAGRAVWQAAHSAIAVGPRGGATLDVMQARIAGERMARS